MKETKHFQASKDALVEIRALMARSPEADLCVKVTVYPQEQVSGRFALEMIDSSERGGGIAVDIDGITFVSDVDSWCSLQGLKMVYVSGMWEEGFGFEGVEAWRSEGLFGEIELLIDKEVNPVVARHGGRIELVELVDGIPNVRMLGGCHGCGLAPLTLDSILIRVLRERWPEMSVVDVTDHAEGAAPWKATSQSD